MQVAHVGVEQVDLLGAREDVGGDAAVRAGGDHQRAGGHRVDLVATGRVGARAGERSDTTR